MFSSSFGALNCENVLIFVSSFWKLVIIDEESIALLKTTYTRVLVEVSIFQDILFCERVHINEEIMVVRFVKEG